MTCKFIAYNIKKLHHTNNTKKSNILIKKPNHIYVIWKLVYKATFQLLWISSSFIGLFRCSLSFSFSQYGKARGKVAFLLCYVSLCFIWSVCHSSYLSAACFQHLPGISLLTEVILHHSHVLKCLHHFVLSIIILQREKIQLLYIQFVPLQINCWIIHLC